MGKKFKTAAVLGLVLGAITVTGCGDKVKSAESFCAQKYRVIDQEKIRNLQESVCVKAAEIANEVAASSNLSPETQVIGGEQVLVLSQIKIEEVTAKAVERCLNETKNLVGSNQQEQACDAGVQFYTDAFVGSDCVKDNGAVICKLPNQPVQSKKIIRVNVNKVPRDNVGNKI